METEKLTHFKILLVAEELKVGGELEGIAVQNSSVKGDWVPRIDNLDYDNDASSQKSREYERRVGIVAELETRHNNILRALTRIEDGAYGTCVVSGKEIEMDRLDANPAADTCIEFKDRGPNL